MSRSARIPLAMHLAESPEEMQLLSTGDGPLYDLLNEFGVWDPTAIPRGARPRDYLRLLAEADRALVIHGTYLDDEEIAFLAAHADRMSVVYCPRTHAYFPHAPYPLAKLLAAGVTVALGTDSRASSPDLNLFEELRFAAAHHAIAPDQLVALATLGGAKALGRNHEIGTIAPGKSADLTVVRLPNVEADPYELLFDPRSSVVATVRASFNPEPTATERDPDTPSPLAPG
jgi:cytosine/adenosine deaminase-related metal-dependent hydrolase